MAGYIGNQVVAQSAGLGATPFRNRVINGDMRIDQQNEGASVTVNSTSVFRSVDMFLGAGTAAAGVFTLQRQTATPPKGFLYYLRATVTTADASPAATSSYLIGHRIEGYNVEDFLLGSADAVTFVISFQIRSSITGTFGGVVKNNGANRGYPWTVTISSANTWTPVSVVVVGDLTGTWATTNSIGMDVQLDLGSGANYRAAAGVWAAGNLVGATGATRLISTLSATLDITGLQVEVGSASTPFERRDFQSELARCQRYYEKSFDITTAPAQNTGPTSGPTTWSQCVAAGVGQDGNFVPFKVFKRTNSYNVTTYNPYAANSQARNVSQAADCTSTAVQATGHTGMTISFSTPASSLAGYRIAMHWVIDARL